MTNRLEHYQAENKQGTVDRIKATAALIEKELGELGYYPENHGRLNRAELCRRAGVGESTLKNATHKDTKLWVKGWLAEFAKKKRAAPTPGAIEAESESLEMRLALLANHYNTSRIECRQLRQDKVDLLAKIEKLEYELAEALAGDKVAVLDRWRKHTNDS